MCLFCALYTAVVCLSVVHSPSDLFYHVFETVKTYHTGRELYVDTAANINLY